MKLDDGVWITHTHTHRAAFFYIKYGFIISILVFLCEDGALWVTGLSLLCTSFINIRLTKDFLFGPMVLPNVGLFWVWFGFQSFPCQSHRFLFLKPFLTLVLYHTDLLDYTVVQPWTGKFAYLSLAKLALAFLSHL